MLPVALTCPLWWVTRWASRLLVGLALTTGLTLGAAAPAVATTPVLPAVAVPSVVLAVPAGVAGMLPGPAVQVAPGALAGLSWPEPAAPPVAAEAAVSAGCAVPDAAVRAPAGRAPAAPGSRAPPVA